MPSPAPGCEQRHGHFEQQSPQTQVVLQPEDDTPDVDLSAAARQGSRTCSGASSEHPSILVGPTHSGNHSNQSMSRCVLFAQCWNCCPPAQSWAHTTSTFVGIHAPSCTATCACTRYCMPSLLPPKG
eukprot:1161421-Pelagomonas_calceolata.AAC.11